VAALVFQNDGRDSMRYMTPTETAKVPIEFRGHHPNPSPPKAMNGMEASAQHTRSLVRNRTYAARPSLDARGLSP
jgi:hypothetical protein